MSNVFKNFLDQLKLTEEDDDGYDDYISELEAKERKTLQKLEQKEAKAQAKKAKAEMFDEDTESEEFHGKNDSRKDRQARGENKPTKVVPIRSTGKGFEVCIMKPTSFEDSQEICDRLLTGRAAIINLEGFDVELAQRIMDFISGAVYAMNGKLHQISSYIFIISPDSVDISGDYLDLIANDGFEVPTLNKEF